MKPSLLLSCAGLFACSTLSPLQAAPAVNTAAPKTAASPFTKPLQGEKRFNHLLNRLTFGPRPGDLAQVQQMGAGAWIESQLNPASIDDSALETELSQLTWLSAPPTRLALAYETDTANFLKRKKEANGEMGMLQLTPRQQETYERIRAANLPERSSILAVGELTTNKLARAIDSKRQLQEVLVDFWSNHFNVDVKKGPVRSLKITEDREVIRPNVFGSFRQLLGASAHSPAMMWYLDNARSTREVRPRAGKATPKVRGGLNENYARELMELHTLGVDGGYTQKDVTEVARCFTGWSVEQQTGRFIFRPNAHDQESKTVLGQVIPAGGGESDGERVLDILATSPATAKFIARKLCVRFVSDNPPASLVERVAAAFTKSNGNLKKTYNTLFFAPEFLSEGAYRSKIKSPLEYTVSAVRALGGTFTVTGERPELRLLAAGAASVNNNNGQGRRKQNKRPLATEIAAMGQPLYSCATPNGYAEDSTKWVSASALVSRLNFALSLTTGRVGDVEMKNDTFRPATVSEIAVSLLGTDLSASTKTTVEAEAQKSPGDGARLRALLLGSPEFQRR
ncbi:DUF1800 domain-containing protein [bacterium]|nr:MAG: DUF1800 domain-containing protein [bacterium]